MMHSAEAADWLELLAESGIVAPSKAALRGECCQLLAIFTAISKKTKAGLADPEFHNS